MCIRDRISVVSPHLIFLCMSFIAKFLKKRNAKKQVLQKQMNKAILPEPFDLTSKYALALNIIFVSLFYSSGMPLLLLFASFSLALQYLVEKYLILRYYSKPVNYSSYLNYKILKLLPYAMILHLAIAIWSYGAEGIFPKSFSIEIIDNSIGEKNAKTVEDETQIQYRIEKVVWLFIALLMLLIIYLIDNTFFHILKGIILRNRKNQVLPAQETAGTYKEEIPKLKQYGIPSYDIMANNKYKEIIEAMQNVYSMDLLVRKHSADETKRGLNCRTEETKVVKQNQIHEEQEPLKPDESSLSQKSELQNGQEEKV
eukprot:TRINITY_DN6674_c0_g1_i2.p1 TRINITY_DN6674_c0_g1~~TRINITY_DN6674_c0_g1_i2.p1  ORF type:complete len:345 (+),score=40.99 TRINITY_DN6674_c0_g1_i2:99-1037(+)